MFRISRGPLADRVVAWLLGLAALAAASVAPAGVVWAQTGPTTAAPAADQGDSATGVGELIVTATRREEDIRKVPSAVSAVTGATIAAAGPILTTGDVLQSLPGVRFNNLQSPVLGEISIRGSGTERASGAESGVGLFVDGAYVGGGQIAGRNFTNLDYFDLDRVEVLEGPQGALYGRDAEYGVVNMVQAQPSFTNSGYVDDAYTFELRSNVAQAVVNHAINDDVAVRVGVEDYSQSGGYYFNPDFNHYYDSTNGWLGRFQVRYKHDRWDIDLLLDHQDLNLPEFNSPYDIPGGGKFPTLPQGFTQNRFVQAHGTLDSLQEKVSNAILSAKYDFGWGILTSTSMARGRDTVLNFSTSYIDTAQESRFQQMGEPGIWPFGHFYQADNANTLYEDLHLGGQAVDSRLNWLVGGELLHLQDDLVSNQITNPCAAPKVGAGLCAGTPTDHICILPTPTSTPCPAVFPFAFGTNSLTDQTYDSESVYGSLSYKLGFGFTVTGDLRYTNDNKKGTRNVFALYTNNPFTFGTGGTIPNPTLYKFSAGQPTYTVTLSYAIPGSWNDLIYGKVGSGYRAGGFNFGDSPSVAPVTLAPAYGDETTTSYEGGLKGNITHYAYFTIDGYYSTTDNAIAITNDGCTGQNICAQLASPFNINGGTVHAYGVEGEVDVNFSLWGGDLSLQVNGSNQSAQYVTVKKVAGGPILGSQVAQIPTWLASSTINYRRPIVDGWVGFINLVYHGQWGGIQDTITTTAPANPLHNFNNLDLRTGIDHESLELSLFIENLTNESYIVFQANNPTNGAPGAVPVPVQARWNEPRTIGLEAKYKW